MVSILCITIRMLLLNNIIYKLLHDIDYMMKPYLLASDNCDSCAYVTAVLYKEGGVALKVTYLMYIWYLSDTYTYIVLTYFHSLFITYGSSLALHIFIASAK